MMTPNPKKKSRAKRAAHMLRVTGKNVGCIIASTVQLPINQKTGQGEGEVSARVA